MNKDTKAFTHDKQIRHCVGCNRLTNWLIMSFEDNPHVEAEVPCCSVCSDVYLNVHNAIKREYEQFNSEESHV